MGVAPWALLAEPSEHSLAVAHPPGHILDRPSVNSHAVLAHVSNGRSDTLRVDQPLYILLAPATRPSWMLMQELTPSCHLAPVEFGAERQMSPAFAQLLLGSPGFHPGPVPGVQRAERRARRAPYDPLRVFILHDS